MFKWFNKLKKETKKIEGSKKIDESNRICPKCIEKMDKLVKGDILIDVCPNCKGIWLDEKEIEKLIEYAANEQKENSKTEASRCEITEKKTKVKK